MGARYYNPTIGHFLTPDNVLPSPTDSLSYDRYAYTRNNPINLTDPTGNFFWAPIIGAVVGGIIAGMSDENIVLGMATGAASGALFGAASGNLLGTIGAGFASGAMNSAVYGGDVLRGAIVGAITAGIGYGMAKIGSAISPDLGKMGMGAVSAISGGVVGGLGSVAMGGSFGEGFKVGFISAGLSYAANEIAAQIDQHNAVTGKPGGAEQTSRKNMPRLDQIQDSPEIQKQREKVLQRVNETGKEQSYAILEKDGKMEVEFAPDDKNTRTKAYNYVRFFGKNIMNPDLSLGNFS